jgi:DNA-binding CsgD family transcriptional regulator/PAS domain-containing protein
LFGLRAQFRKRRPPSERKCFDLGFWGAVTSDLIELSAVIGDIYDAAIDPALWKRALGSICTFVGGDSAALFWHDSATQRSEVLHLFNEDPHYTRLYFEKYLTMNPVFPAATFMEAGHVHTVNDIIPQDELEKTRFYKEWVEPQGIMDVIAVNLEKGTTSSSLLNIRTGALADAEARRRLALLVPHVQRAVSIGRLFDQGKAAETALATTLDHVEAAVLLVDADGAIAFANEPAKAMLAEGTMIRLAGNALRAVSAETDRILRDVFESARSGDASVGVRGVAVPLTASSQERWFAHVLPLTSGNRRQAGLAYAAVAAIFIRKTVPDAPPPLEAIAKLYKLTASEVRVLDAVLKVNGVKAMAEILGVSQATVKTHLHNVFRKTGTKRQSDLVKLLTGI